MAAGFTVTDDKGDVPAAAEFLMTNELMTAGLVVSVQYLYLALAGPTS